ncbi:hypothetical protein [Pseudomonas sp. 9Ag]|uniref:hypothetical protein n=1 Tax=Pseudomonas sp. 9Ag TaxID=2653167 RepID=UPI0012EEF1B1|nr:hypothetical protein [Pseudomonas sp. 9Ag]VXD04066.1 exported hypothetical protein [Pseudomonas sp. 9Ag]
MLRYLIIGFCLLVGGVQAAEPDPFTQVALESFEEALASHEQAHGRQLEAEAQFLMAVKDGLSLYRDGHLTEDDKGRLLALVTSQAEAASKTLNQWGVDDRLRTLATKMQAASLQAKQLLNAAPTAAAQAAMERYHTGAGYDAYRYAQDLGIEQM